MKSICVFCASSIGNDSAFVDSAKTLGALLADRQITLIYGGGNVGLMGVIADEVLKNGGSAIGVIPQFLQKKEVAHLNLSKLIVCETMHERKMKMFELAQGFVALPGGFGTLEEVVEILTWRQLNLHQFPIGILNVNGFYDPLRMLFDEMASKQLLKPEHKNFVVFEKSSVKLLERMTSLSDLPNRGSCF